ncbi:MAG TPA: hypothetical protein PLV25_04295, partial [Opitutales bacterium]|nr:hypothetical protein [Opitutales bacterium]
LSIYGTNQATNSILNLNVANALTGTTNFYGSGLTVGIGNNGAFGSSALNVESFSVGGDIAFEATGGAKTISNNITFENLAGSPPTRFTGTNNMTFTGTLALGIADQAITSDSSANTTFSGNLGMSTYALSNSITGSGNMTFSGSVSGSGLITKTGTGTGELVFSGSSANTNTGGLTINGGTVVFNKTAGVNAMGAGTIAINSGGTLLLGASNQTSSSNAMTLAGGTFATGGNSTTLGTLTLSANSTIDMGTGASIINFADSSGTSWTSGQLLTITNWSGSSSGGGTDQLYFGNSATGLTAGQVSQIRFLIGGNLVGAQILSTGEVVPTTPEPTALWGAVGLGIFAAGYELRRRMRLAALAIDDDNADATDV